MTALTPIFPYMEDVSYLNTLEELIAALPKPYQLKISQASSQTSVWKEIASMALEDNDQHTLVLLARTNQEVLPYTMWFDFEHVQARKKHYLENELVDGISRFRWCMSEPGIREQFSPAQRGQFIHAGLVMVDNIVVERAVGQGDWERNIPLPALFMHLERQDYDELSWLNGQFIDWYHQHLLAQRPIEDQYYMLIGWYGLTTHTMKKQSMRKAIADIDGDNETHSYDNLLGAMNQIKLYMKWEQMPTRCRNMIMFHMEVNQEPLGQSFFRQGTKRKIEEAIKEITSFLNYLKLDEKLNNANHLENESPKTTVLKI